MCRHVIMAQPSNRPRRPSAVHMFYVVCLARRPRLAEIWEMCDVRDVDLSFFSFDPAKKFARSTSHKDVTVVRNVFLRKELVNDALWVPLC